METKSAVKLPTFAIIGAGKSGTTALHNYLDQHPEVFMSKVKETNFFALEGATEIESGEDDPAQMHHYPWSITSFDAYKDLFKDATENSIGETSPMYMYGEGVIGRIKKYTPDIKMIAILRHPVDRLYSRYLHLAREDRTPTEHFADALNKDNLWWIRNDLVKEGFYYNHLSKFFEAFPKNQLKIFLYDDLRADSDKLIHDIFEYIGVDASFAPDQSIEHNVSGKIKNRFIDKLIGQNSVLKSTVQKVFPGIINSMKNSHWAQSKLTDMRKKNLEKPKLTKELRQQMIDEIYKDDILKLQQLLDRDLSHWLK